MSDIQKLLETWQLDEKTVRERVYGALTDRECERWNAIWLLVWRLTATQVGEVLEQERHTIDNWLEELEWIFSCG